MTVVAFQMYILNWYEKHKRDYLPWRPSASSGQVDPYHILVSEIMLQQTQVSRVLQKYPEFLKAFPTIQSLKNASLRTILKVWQGMGYNRRALYLQKIAKAVAGECNGVIPSDPEELQKLSGIGSYTAGAIACFAFGKPIAFLDSNIRKVYVYHFFYDRRKSDTKIDDREILELAKKALYKQDPRKWHYALMDYGAVALVREKGVLDRVKAYHRQSSFLDSTRYFRSKIVRHLLRYKTSANLN
ncbi:MAG: A/G-specific adenine glycosylase [Candidatus Colwellbacteria bacterium]|nr:A/G-specific adenine glycosylase [Candidatus Colwellbacteria bacterium]